MLLVAATVVVVLIFLYDCIKRFEFKYRESLSLSYLKPFAIKKKIQYFILLCQLNKVKQYEQGGDGTPQVSINLDNINRDRLVSLLVQEEAHWRQRSTNHWLREGDLNTHFFHVAASARRRSNKIEKLQGNVVTNPRDLCQIARDYFQNLFTMTQGTYDPVLRVVRRCVSEEDNANLLRPFAHEEFTAAIYQMGPIKLRVLTDSILVSINVSGIPMVQKFLKHAVVGLRGDIFRLP